MNIKQRLTDFSGKPRNVLYLSFGLGLLIVLTHIFFLQDMFRDVGHAYAYCAREIANGNWGDGFHVKLPVIQLGLAGLLGYCGMAVYPALILVTGLFYLLTGWPLYILLKRFMPPLWASWGVLAYMLAPKIIRFGCVGLPESARTFFIVWGVLMLALTVERATLKRIILFAVTLAGLSLSRAEGLIVALAFIGILGIEILRTADGGAGRRIWRAVWSAGAVFLFTAVLLSPRLYQVWSYCGYPVTDARMVGVLDPVFNPERAQAFADGERKAVENVPADGIEDDDKKSGVAERFIDCLEDQSRGLYEVYLPFTLLGLILLIMRRAWRREYSYMLLLIGLNFVLFYISVSSYRYYTVALPLAMVFTVYGGAEVAVWVRKFRLVWVAVVLLAVLAVFQILNGIDMVFRGGAGRIDRETGEWLTEHRGEFLPAGESRRLRIYNQCATVFFWSGGEAVNPYGTHKVYPENAKGFDLAVVYTDDEDMVTRLLNRGDVEKVEHPHSDVVTVLKYKGGGDK